MTSLEISKKLYAAFPLWDDTDSRWLEDPQSPEQNEILLLDDLDSPGVCPAYTSDSLMARLPLLIATEEAEAYLTIIRDEEGVSALYEEEYWDYNEYEFVLNELYPAIADTLADALALLAIKLREEKIL